MIRNFNAGRRFVVVVAALAVLGVAAYFGQRELTANAQSDDPVPVSAAVPKAQNPAKTQPPAVEPAAVVVAPPVATAAVGPGNSAAPSANRPEIKPAAKRTMLANRATFATADGDPPDAVAPPPEPEKPVPVPAPPPRPVPDRWQNMRDALSECDRLGIFDGLICGQRVRIQYCEGYWGKVSQCPGANAGYER